MMFGTKIETELDIASSQKYIGLFSRVDLTISFSPLFNIFRVLTQLQTVQ